MDDITEIIQASGGGGGGGAAKPILKTLPPF